MRHAWLRGTVQGAEPSNTHPLHSLPLATFCSVLLTCSETNRISHSMSPGVFQQTMGPGGKIWAENIAHLRTGGAQYCCREVYYFLSRALVLFPA